MTRIRPIAWRHLSLLALLSLFMGQASAAAGVPLEWHDRIALGSADDRSVALTLDACSGRYDADLIDFLVRNRIPATLFVTRRWLDANPQGVQTIRTRLKLFDVEDHGEQHILAVIGAGRRVYGIPGEPDLLHLRREVEGGGAAVTRYFGVAPHWYRGATAEYDQQAAEEIRRLGYGIAGFSVNADAGATLPRAVIEQRMRAVQAGDIVIAHMNRPQGQTAEGLRPALLELLRRGLRFFRAARPGAGPTGPLTAPDLVRSFRDRVGMGAQ